MLPDLRLILQSALLLACLSLQNSACAAGASLKFHGFYVSAPEFDQGSYFCEYLRFYPDGVVITVNSECGAESRRAINLWFHRDKAGKAPEYVSIGRAEISGNHLNFNSRLEEVEVIYWGKIRQRSLRMHSLSRFNGYRDFKTYRFYPYAEPENLRE
jgi:hypothetical protein